jgi:hypothetical protein
MSAFTALYAVIIGFYFGSRAYEKIKELKDAEEVLKIQYIMDEIGADEFREKRWVLRGLKPNSQLEMKKDKDKNEITITHEGGDNIAISGIRMIMKVNKVKKKFDLLPSNSKQDKDIFEVTDKMVIKMEQKKVTFEVENKPIPSHIYDDGVAMAEWNNTVDVEVNVVYKPTNEIISTMKWPINPPPSK